MDGSWRTAGPLPDGGAVFAVDARADGGAIVLALRGELDLAGAPRLAGALEALMAEGHAHIALDLGRLAFIDGAGVGLIERARRELRARGGELTLRHPQAHVRRVIGLCAGLSDPGRARSLPAVAIEAVPPRTQPVAVGP